MRRSTRLTPPVKLPYPPEIWKRHTKSPGKHGLAYYKLGGTQKAEAMLVEASERTEKLGQVASHVGWLTNAAYIDLDAGRFSVQKNAPRQFDRLVLGKEGRIAKRRVDIRGNGIRYPARIVSRVSPAASSPSSRATGKRKPRMQGLPVQIAGSIVMREKP